MIKFPANDEIEVFVNVNGHITFKRIDSYSGQFDVVCLTTDQFSEVMAFADDLLIEADEVKSQKELDDDSNS